MSNLSTTLKAGDIYLTTYGVAVIIKVNENEGGEVESFRAKLWRQPGKSVATSATATLATNCIIKQLPAAPGMATIDLTKEESKQEHQQHVLIHSYVASEDKYIVSKIEEESDEDNQRFTIMKNATISNDNTGSNVEKDNARRMSLVQSELYQLKPDQIAMAKSAKFYPLIDELITRGNEATAAAKTMMKETKIIEKLSETKDAVINTASSEGSDMISNVNTEQITEKVKSALPSSEDVNEVYNMLKDEELTSLLEKGRQRLEQLTSGGVTAATQDALKEMGITINDSDGPTSLAEAQEKALQAINDLLSENLDVDLESMKKSLGSTFETMFDSFSEAAQSDGMLNSLLMELNNKTSEWQQQTGRLLDTKSSSLFFEGAQRLQSRVGNIFSPTLKGLSENSRASLTKAFTEGDVALTKLKSLELGDSVRSRLFQAIEARSDSHGGLDGIIAGAVSQMGGEDLLNSIKNRSSDMSNDAQESLISLLSQRSQYHDITVLKLEETLLNLESHLDEDMTAEQIAKLARGEGGTSALFEPIAKNAAKEIENQLDAAEKSVEDPRILAVISHVRKIMSGDLTLSNLFDEVTNVLNNDDVVNAGASIAQRGEQILDAIENASENKGVSDLIIAAEQAGITKDTVLESIESMDVNSILDTAEQAVSDEKKRIELLSSATDSALDFLLRILPAMPVPPFEGVKDGLIYSIENLSMKGFRLKKEDIMVEIAGIKAAEQSGANATIVPNETTGDDISVRVKKSTDVLIIDVRNISALLDEAIWKFEKTSFPYLKGKGSANVNLSDGTIRLEFELRKRKLESAEAKWEPVLCLHNSLCTIGQIDLTIDGASKLAWVVNKLAAIFRGPLKNYVVRVIMDMLKNRSGWLLQNLNGLLSAHWDLILKTTGMTLDDLDEASENDIIAPIPDPADDEIDLVWTEFVPLGINLVLNDKSGKVKVKDFPRGSQARQVANKKGVDPESLNGATIIAVNGTTYDPSQRTDLVLKLKEPERPKTVKFRLLKGNINGKSKNRQSNQNGEVPSNIVSIDSKYLVIEQEGPLGLEFCSSVDNNYLVVKSLTNDGLAKNSNVDNRVSVGDILTSINKDPIMKGKAPYIQNAYECLEKNCVGRPLTMEFVRPHLIKVVIEQSECQLQSDGPEEILLKEVRSKEGTSKVFLDGFRGVDGAAESSGVIIGDNLIFMNGMPVGAGTKLRPDSSLLNVQSFLEDENAYPMCLHFARQASNGQRQAEFDIESEDIKTFSVTVENPQQLGCRIKKLGVGQVRYVVQQFRAVSGHFNKTITDTLQDSKVENFSFYSINDEVLPSYVSCDMVQNALRRAWKSGKLEILLCDESVKQYLKDVSERDETTP